MSDAIAQVLMHYADVRIRSGSWDVSSTELESHAVKKNITFIGYQKKWIVFLISRI